MRGRAAEAALFTFFWLLFWSNVNAVRLLSWTLSSLCPSPQVDLRASPMGAAQDNHGTTTHYSSSNQHEISTGTGVLNWSDSSEWKLMTGNCSSWEIHGNGRSDENCSSMFAPVWMIFFLCQSVLWTVGVKLSLAGCDFQTTRLTFRISISSSRVQREEVVVRFAAQWTFSPLCFICLPSKHSGRYCIRKILYFCKDVGDIIEYDAVMSFLWSCFQSIQHEVWPLGKWCYDALLYGATDYIDPHKLYAISQ